MGIPSFFSFITRKYKNTVLYSKHAFKNINNLYIDANSIIYDSIQQLKNENTFPTEQILFQKTFQNLKDLINNVSPNKQVYICFDGVPPFAKIKQQRERRFKNKIINDWETSLNNTNNREDNLENIFDKCNITTGTTLMNNLDTYIQNQLHSNNVFPNLQIYFSGSTKTGEGEHKIFQFIKSNIQYHQQSTTYIYGLDADLIILCLHHNHLCDKLYLFRETHNKDNIIHLNIQSLYDSIYNTITIHNFIKKSIIISDYTLLSFLLGNDFLPHSPFLNIRTTGIYSLLNAYKNTIHTKNLSITEENKINWKNFKYLIKYLSSQEETLLKNEYMTRNKKQTIPDDKQKLQYLPMFLREKEHYINPLQPGWKTRYYKALFDINYQDKKSIQHICLLYLQGFEWTYHYYTHSKSCSSWVYPYHYPPLFSDLLHYFPVGNCSLLHDNNVNLSKIIEKPMDPLEQLCYVLPPTSFNLLPSQIQKEMDTFHEKYTSYFNNHLDWTFCTFLWESHIYTPPIFREFVKYTIKKYRKETNVSE